MLLEAVKEKGAHYDEMKRLEAANMRLVVSLINQFQHRGLTFEELIEAGEASLRKAITNFNLNSGIKFITYTVTQIRQDTEALTAQNCPKEEERKTQLREIESALLPFCVGGPELIICFVEMKNQASVAKWPRFVVPLWR